MDSNLSQKFANVNVPAPPQGKSCSHYLPGPLLVPDMEDLEKRHRVALESFRARRDLTVNDWCKRAGLREGTLRKFLYGYKGQYSQSIGYLNLAKLAAVERVTVAEMMGEILPRDASMGTVAIPWLSVTVNALGEPIAEVDHDRAAYRMPRGAVERHLLNEPERGRFLEMPTDALAPEIRAGDSLCIDIQRILPHREAGFYCVWNGQSPQIAQLTPLPKDRMRFMAETNLGVSQDYGSGEIPIIGRVVWRSGSL